MVFRAAYAHPDVEVVAVNDPFMVSVAKIIY